MAENTTLRRAAVSGLGIETAVTGPPDTATPKGHRARLHSQRRCYDHRHYSVRNEGRALDRGADVLEFRTHTHTQCHAVAGSREWFKGEQDNRAEPPSEPQAHTNVGAHAIINSHRLEGNPQTQDGHAKRAPSRHRRHPLGTIASHTHDSHHRRLHSLWSRTRWPQSRDPHTAQTARQRMQPPRPAERRVNPDTQILSDTNKWWLAEQPVGGEVG